MKKIVKIIKAIENVELTASYYFLTEKKVEQAKHVKVIKPNKEGTIEVIGGFYKPVSKIKFEYEK